MKVLVSGGTGYVGRFIVEDLLAAGHGVVLFGRRAPEAGFFSGPTAFVAGNLDPGRDQDAAFTGVDAFVHAAFDHLPGKYRGGEGDDPETFRHRNLDGTVALFRQAKASGVRRVVFLSSRAVYGRQPPGAALTEATEPRPDTLYGQVKLAAERELAQMAGDGFTGVSLRVTGVYGVTGTGRAEKWRDLIHDFVVGKPVTPRVATEVHGRDVAAAVRLALEREAIEVLNVSDLVVDRRDICAIVNEVAQTDHPLPSPGDVGALNVMDCARLRALGWRPGGRDQFEDTVRALARDVLRELRM